MKIKLKLFEGVTISFISNKETLTKEFSMKNLLKLVTTPKTTNSYNGFIKVKDSKAYYTNGFYIAEVPTEQLDGVYSVSNCKDKEKVPSTPLRHCDEINYPDLDRVSVELPDTQVTVSPKMLLNILKAITVNNRTTISIAIKDDSIFLSNSDTREEYRLLGFRINK